MRILRAGHSASRAFSLWTMFAGRPAAPVMVPLSVLEDFKVHAARVAQLNDARFYEVKEHAARVAQLNDANAARVLEDFRAHAAHVAQLSDARIDEVKSNIKFLAQVTADKVAMALYDTDVARCKVTARALMEEALADFWRAWGRLDAEQRQQVCPGVKKFPFSGGPSSGTEQLKLLLSFPAVAAYLEVAEEDNGLARGVLAKSAGAMYPALCTQLHGRAAGELAVRLPAGVFSAIGEHGRIAFAALLAFGGRNVGMYQPDGATVPVVLRVPPMLGLKATLMDIRGSAKWPAAEAPAGLGGAAGGAGASGE